MRVGVTGPSELTYNEERFVADTSYSFLKDCEPTEAWSGMAHGADSIFMRAAMRAHVPLLGMTIPTGAWYNERFEQEMLQSADTTYDFPKVVVKRTKAYPHSKDAYMPRNDLTVASIDVLLAFPPNSRMPDRVRGGRGAGTWATVRRALKKKLQVCYYPLDGSTPWIEGGLLEEQTERLFG